MLRSILKQTAVVLLGLGAPAAVAESGNTEIAHTNLRTATGDFATLLNELVTDVGRSEHKHVSRNISLTGTRLVSKAKRSSWIEGNRLSFEEIDEHEAEVIRLIRDDMVVAAKHFSVKEMQADEQLAFWLNLHNLTVISHISEAYPIGDIYELLFESRPESESGAIALYDQKFAVIDGERWSLADIEAHIFTNWQNPLVMYGLFYGTIGSPNIRTAPYRAGSVWANLKDNAAEFINSIRGTQVWGRRLAISQHYARAANLFPDFDRDVKVHILSQIESPQWHKRIKLASRVDPSVDNWRVADFFDGRPGRISTSFAKSFSPGGQALVAYQTMPAYTRELALKIARRNSRRDPIVRVEELEAASEDEPGPER